MNIYLKTTLTDFYGWSRLEYLWLFVCSVTIAATSVIMGATLVEFVSSVTGIIGAILVAKGKLSSYYWGFVATALYAYISFTYKMYGETIMYTLLFTPLQLIGGILWSQKLKLSEDGQKADVVKKWLTTQQRLIVTIGTLIVIAAYAYGVSLLKGYSPGLDSATAILSVLATVLMVLRYSEQWLVWILVNTVAIIMWVQATIHHQGAGAAILAMWVTFWLNSLYGWYKWKKNV
ncbi:TPA: nicotinamide mononucleotide transporter [Klebsiella pneumoniae]|nr:nicotinamide mononucleotide transporter [Klebsiella pneumoniae]